MLMMLQTLYLTEINQIFQVLVWMRKKTVGSNMQYEIMSPITDQLILKNLTMTFFQVLQLKQVIKQVLTIKAKQRMNQLNVYIVGERQIQQLVIIRFWNKMALLQYFSKFITTEFSDIVLEQTNIYSFQTIHKSINTNGAEIMSLIGMSIKMEILQLPSYKLY